MRTGDTIRIAIDKPAAGGRMIARLDGAIVLVSGAIPGETVEATVEKVQRGTIWATAHTIVEPSADRTGQADSCGGCVFSHIAYDRQLALKRLIIEDAFTRIARLPLDIPLEMTPSPVDGYRMRARLHVRKGSVGFFRENTHDLCAAGPTRQLLPATVALLDTLTGMLPSVKGLAGEVELSENRDASDRTLHFEISRPVDRKQLAKLGTIDGLSGVSCASAGAARAVVVAGSPRVADTFVLRGTPFTLTRDARAFFQGNRFLVEALMQHVVDALADGPVLDLYAGVGLFSIAAAAAGAKDVTAVEGDPVSAADLATNGVPYADHLRTRYESVEEFLVTGDRPVATATVVVDPPRTGLSKEALQGILALSAPVLVYVSCDVATLARDARQLIDAGYRLTHARGFDLFPHTAHVETVMVFSR